MMDLNKSLEISGVIFAIKNENVIIIKVHAAPKTHPGGVHGAFCKAKYQGPFTALAVNSPPIPNAAKLRTR